MRPELVTRPHAANLVRWAAERPEVLVLSADLTASCEADDFRRAYPERFFSLGMAEQNMMGYAAGLAREGFTPFVHTFAVFVCRRPYDQVAMSIAYPNLRVRLLGFVPGLTTPGGASHQAIDDLALMRVLPNMTVLECGDATEVESVLDAVQPVDGPVYVRMLRGEVPRLFDPALPMSVDRARSLAGGGEAPDVALLTSGVCTGEALRLTPLLAERGVAVRHLHVSTLKPFGDPELLRAVRAARHGVITLENHSVIGGLGSATAELMAGAGVGRRLVRLGLQDTFAHGGSKPYLMQTYGLDALALLGAAEELLGRTLGIAAEDLLAAPAVAGPARPPATAEDL
jgi:transketolase